jgi:hypothetical protein
MSLITVAEAILDEAAEEYRDQNLANKESVARYADSINIQLTDYHADAVLTVCKLWIENTEEDHWNGTDDYEEHVTEPLEYLDREIELSAIVKKEVRSEEDLRTLCSAVNEIYYNRYLHGDYDFCLTLDLSDLPLDNRCRGTYSTDGIWSWAVPDPAYDNAPKFVMMDNGDECNKEEQFVIVEFADDDYLHDCWDVTIEEEA